MHVLKHDPESVPSEQGERMTRFWVDESWKSAAYSTTGNLFGYEEKTDNETVIKAFRERLLGVAGFNMCLSLLPCGTHESRLFTISSLPHPSRSLLKLSRTFSRNARKDFRREDGRSFKN